MGLFGPTNADLLRELRRLQIQVQADAAAQADRDLETTQQLARIESRVRSLATRLICPLPISLSITGDVNAMLKFQVHLPPTPPAPHDVVKGELSVSIAGQSLPPLDVELGATSVAHDAFVGNDNDPVELSLVYVDDAGNRSQASTLAAVLTDNIAPSAPGELALSVVEETFAAPPSEPATEPAPEPEPVSEAVPEATPEPTSEQPASDAEQQV